MAPNKRWHPSEEPDDLVFAVCDRFLKQLGMQYDPRARNPGEKRVGAATAVALWVADVWKRPDLTRERIYPLFWEATRRGFLMLTPPRESELARQIAARYEVNEHDDDAKTIQVVNARGRDAFGHVARVGADLVHELVRELGKKKSTVHLGLGAGFAAMVVAKRLARLVYSDRDCPDLVLHALSAGGFLVDRTEKVPGSWFGYFDGVLPKVECVGLFSESVVPADEYDRVTRNPGVRHSMQRAKEIDIVVTSLASARHDHGLIARYLDYLKTKGELSEQDRRRIDKAGWIGDVQFCPYNAERPVSHVFPVRAVTLFEIPDLVGIAAEPDKHVVLLGGPCGECAVPKTEAIRPLLTNKALRVWSHLITDVQTAAELVD